MAPLDFLLDDDDLEDDATDVDFQPGFHRLGEEAPDDGLGFRSLYENPGTMVRARS